MYAAITVGLGTAISLGLAAAIFPLGSRSQAFMKGALYLPTVVSAVVVTMVWAWIYNPPYGVLNWILSLFGAEPVAWLGTSTTALPALMVMALATGRGLGVLLITASMATIPEEVYEAARLDGAGRWSLFRRITFPLIKPVVFYLVVISTIEAANILTPVWVLTRGGPGGATSTIAFEIYRTAFSSFDLGLAAAQSMILLLILLPGVVYLLPAAGTRCRLLGAAYRRRRRRPEWRAAADDRGARRGGAVLAPAAVLDGCDGLPVAERRRGPPARADPRAIPRPTASPSCSRRPTSGAGRSTA